MDANGTSFALELATGLSFVLFAGAFWAISSLGQWAIAPVERFAGAAIRPARVPTRFSLSELGLLLTQVQLAAAACLWMTASDHRWATTACALACCGVTAMWWVSLRRLTICRVQCRRRRRDVPRRCRAADVHGHRPRAMVQRRRGV